MPDNLTFRYLQDICCFCAHSIGINFRSLFVFLSKNFYKKDYDMSEEVKQMQDDEREALISIYEGDEAFKQINPTTFQYKYGTEADEHTFLVELAWGDEYPNEGPKINMNVFYNQHLVDPVKQKIVEALQAEAEQWIGCGMTYTLFECLKDRIEEMMEGQPQHVSDDESSGSEESDESDSSDADIGNLSISKTPKAEKLTKAQKRRQWDKATAGGGERPRGYDWVDIVKHLSQVGSKEEAGAVPQNYDG